MFITKSWTLFLENRMCNVPDKLIKPNTGKVPEQVN